MQHLALAYCPTSCPLVSSRLPLLPVILFTYLGIFSLCPLLFNPMALYVIALIPGLPSPYTITAPQNQSSRQQTFLETQYAPWLATTRTSFRFIAFFSREPYFFLHRCQLEAQRAFLPCVRHLAQGRTSPLWSQGCSKYLHLPGPCLLCCRLTIFSFLLCSPSACSASLSLCRTHVGTWAGQLGLLQCMLLSSIPWSKHLVDKMLSQPSSLKECST